MRLTGFQEKSEFQDIGFTYKMKFERFPEPLEFDYFDIAAFRSYSLIKPNNLDFTKKDNVSQKFKFEPQILDFQTQFLA